MASITIFSNANNKDFILSIDGKRVPDVVDFSYSEAIDGIGRLKIEILCTEINMDLDLHDANINFIKKTSYKRVS